MSFYYQIYGLRVASSRKISLLKHETNQATIDLKINWTTSASEATGLNLEWSLLRSADSNAAKNISAYSALTETGTLFKLEFFTENILLTLFFDKHTHTAWLIYSENETDGNLDSYFVGVVLGCIMRLQGMICLHGSAVNIAGKAVVFLGSKRSGKSTTAAAFAKLGFNVLADDIAVLALRNGQYYVQPGYPNIRLRPASLSVLQSSAHVDEFKLVHTHRDSRYTDITDTFQCKELSLGGLYILKELPRPGTQSYIEPALTDGLTELIKNSFAKYLSTGYMRRAEFESLSQLTNVVPVKKLYIPYHLDGLNNQCRLVITDFSNHQYG